jgi:hypothetical protein
MRRVPRYLVRCALAALLVGSVGCAAAASPAASPVSPAAASAGGASETGFNPTTVSLGAGQSATITITAVGLQPGDTAAQFGVVHNLANTTITSPQCVGVFAGADINQAAQPTGALLACTFGSGGASGTTGELVTFTLTNVGGGAETISFNPASTFYLTSTFATESAGAMTSLTVTN